MHDNVVGYNQKPGSNAKNEVNDLLLPVALKMENVSRLINVVFVI